MFKVGQRVRCVTSCLPRNLGEIAAAYRIKRGAILEVEETYPNTADFNAKRSIKLTVNNSDWFYEEKYFEIFDPIDEMIEIANGV